MSDSCRNGCPRLARRRGLCQPCLDAAPRVRAPGGATVQVEVTVPTDKVEAIREIARRMTRRVLA
jgi:hypothetical protein